MYSGLHCLLEVSAEVIEHIVIFAQVKYIVFHIIEDALTEAVKNLKTVQLAAVELIGIVYLLHDRSKIIQLSAIYHRQCTVRGLVF